MQIRPRRARVALSQVELGRVHSGWPVGLRDGAILALLAVGLSTEEICDLRASAITMERDRLLVTVHRYGAPWCVTLPLDLGARLLAWLTERRLWADPVPVFIGRRGRRLSSAAVYQVLFRYRRQKRTRR